MSQDERTVRAAGLTRLTPHAVNASQSATFMPLKDQIKNYGRKLMESKPDADALAGMVRHGKATCIMFADDGIIPNHPRWPLVIHRAAVRFEKPFDPATIIDTLFAANGWGRSWRDSIYDFLHYHSQTHEVLGVARGDAVIEFGGIRGKRLTLRAGDVAVLPAGTGHRLIEASRNFLVVGAYPPDGTYDECTDTREADEARKRILKVKKPPRDPIHGKGGLTVLWTKRRS
jgi:uncharacterized protein YjlB